MLMLRRDFASRGVHVWKLSDEEFKAQLREGLRRCVEVLEADAATRTGRGDTQKLV
jgi:hypothetical protein